MKFSLSWLKQHLETEADAATVAETLMRIGLEVEAVSNPAEALAPFRPDLPLPVTVRDRLVKHRGQLQARVEPGEPNAESTVELLEPGDPARYRLTPATGQTHQLRVHLAALGTPIRWDPLYPQVLPREPGDVSRPLQLLARTLRLTHPVTGQALELRSRRRLETLPR